MFLLSIEFRAAIGVLMAFALVLQRGAAFTSQTCKKISHSSSVLKMANDDASPSNEGSRRVLRLLALHGSEGSGLEFAESLAPLQETLTHENIELEIVAPTAPFPKGAGFAWWTMAPGERSFNAKSYLGFETSEEIVLQALQEKNPDMVLAHSQGAILISALLGLGKISTHPPLGYVLNGVAWPNPYTQPMQTFKAKDSPRVLFVMGQADRINSPSSAQQVQASLEKAEFDVEVWKHPGGHSVPTKDAEAMKALSQWITRISIDS